MILTTTTIINDLTLRHFIDQFGGLLFNWKHSWFYHAGALNDLWSRVIDVVVV